MPSIMMTWSGPCPGRSDREHLVKRLTELAEISAEKFDERYDRYDRELTGRILIHAGVFDEYRVPPSLVPEPGHPDLYSVEKARISGIDFRLPTIYGGRADDNRVSFIFLCADDEPALDGFVVRVHDAETCRRFEQPEVQSADWLLTAPHLHLRYAFEEWMASLLAWVRIYYMPGLKYAEFDHLHGEEYASGEHEKNREFHFERLKSFHP